MLCAHGLGALNLLRARQGWWGCGLTGELTASSLWLLTELQHGIPEAYASQPLEKREHAALLYCVTIREQYPGVVGSYPCRGPRTVEMWHWGRYAVGVGWGWVWRSSLKHRMSHMILRWFPNPTQISEISEISSNLHGSVVLCWFCPSSEDPPYFWNHFLLSFAVVLLLSPLPVGYFNFSASAVLQFLSKYRMTQIKFIMIYFFF